MQSPGFAARAACWQRQRRARLAGLLALATVSVRVPTSNAATPDANPEGDARHPAAEATFSVLGRVTVAEARAEIPLTSHVALVPATEELYLAPVAGEAEGEFHPHAAIGLAAEQPGDWDWEVAVKYGPRYSGISSLGASLDVAKGFGANWKEGLPPGLTLDLSLGATRFTWSDDSLTGVPITQLRAEAGMSVKLSRALELRVREMYFVYNPELAPRSSDAVDALGVLAHVGTYPPTARVGVRLTWNAAAKIALLIEGNALTYAADIGTGNQIEAGLQMDLARGWRVTIAGGLLRNSLGGVASELADARTVPLFNAACEMDF